MSFGYARPPSVRPVNSLRLRLLAFSVLVELIMLTLLVTNSVRLIQTHLSDSTQLRLQAQESSYNITLAGQLAERDYAALQSIIEGWGASKGITYMVVTNAAGKVVAAWGHDGNGPLPSAEKVLSPELDEYRGAFDVVFLGQRYGEARYGLDTRFLGTARRELLHQSLGIAVVEVVLTVTLLAAIGYWLTRHLDMLARASLKVAGGDFSIRLKMEGKDEIAVLTQAFNTMSVAVESRIQDLDESQKRFRAIADFTYAWENWFDTEGHLRWVNPAVERITGYSVAECHEMEGFPLPMVVGDDRPQVSSVLASAQNGQSGQDMEFRIQNKQGDILWVAMSWQPIFDGEGAPLGTRSSIRDISVQKHSSDLAVEAKGELERMLFAASHDLQEPIRYILAYTQRLDREFGGEMPERAQSSMTFIREGANQLSLLVKGLVDYTRSNRPMTAFAPVDCRRVVDQAIADCTAMSTANPPQFRVGEMPVVQADPVLLFILFENLISNAIKFVRPDVPPQVNITAQAEEEGWRIDISDNGIGIDPQYLQTIIRPFSRLHSRSTFPGAGLGLASALKVAKIHGGRLWLDSEPGKGTTVHIWLPTKAQPEVV
ncbi:Phytochrome two-component sensor histidine kinase Cyanobacterial phytochrome B [Paramagnetospirillum magnetotacticum MS-1]|uniref:histidine kinase n=1 Tax=Paramagnetospirillum magnetotacticum MS-1 TaxID=272627 RepID=A0A0C2V6J4_PARME|nr:ATP-binding protein [Paramagnetospirillum magnetotacticum]KIM00672.1 Phytochrome two-component sensor histidine kinase Cyanobacterial phytochrome B [Paramagnetospirillum magnetotacticum MS-1]